MSNIQNGPLVVTGASGQLGRQVVELLVEAGASPIVAVSRNPEKVADLQAKGVETRQGDFNDPASLEAAFAGGKRLLIISTDDLEPGKRLVAHSNAVAAAKAAGVNHIVYTSLTNPASDSPIGFSSDHEETEKLIAASGADYTILRNNLYTDLLLMGGPQSIAMGSHYAAAAEGKTGYVTRADCARAAAAALMTSTGKQTLDITGPQAVSQAEVAAILSEVAGKDIPYIALPAEDLVQAMIGNGLPEFMARVFVSFDEAIAQGYLDVAGDDLNTLTGQPGQTVRDFLLANRGALLAPQS
ncbi:MAG: SDR family oxidoreductase [Pseudophaeobacter sp. bin_em_oilr2.035]|jgi:NAD(P)H dehydrogenase (quinone)|uniref:SDR family oxidoreductase n=1 Tax=Ruegeria aquimaris TaxID=2984333 RepID=A0ABT3AQK3_9RHOB|nr:SDR family oxidoreductase [Ruegeria sp. XHP0148]MCV2890943.1 SDR family oxidoreductase [Ruegeria sp. XHP0148]MDF1773979.1 SDR family oxidoreductase [Pseudophaeobacter sp. bin_em_oilr2.035]TNE91137.1 MAG: SDR family oxidoreductase [Paracoccaceae bacterium]